MITRIIFCIYLAEYLFTYMSTSKIPPEYPIVSVQATLRAIKEQCPQGAYMLKDYIHGFFGEWLDNLDKQFSSIETDEQRTRPILYFNEPGRAWDDHPDFVELKDWHFPSEADNPTIYLSPPVPDTEPVQSYTLQFDEENINAVPPNGSFCHEEYDIDLHFTPTPSPVAPVLELTPCPGGDKMIASYETPIYREQPDFDNFQSWLYLINSGGK